MIAVIRDNNADVDIEETENIANIDISDRDRNNKGRRHLLRRSGLHNKIKLFLTL